MQTFWGILRVLGGCGITIFMLAFFVVIVLIVPMMITLRLCAFVPMSRRQLAESFDPLKAALVTELGVKDAILDGEIACLDEEGKSLFAKLLFRRGRPIFAAFDLLWVNGEDLRPLPLMERKKRLRQIVPHASSHVLHVDYLPEKGKELFQLACEKDLEGVVGKWARGTYQSDGRSTSWIKIKNPNYSQAEGRAELFDGKRRLNRRATVQLRLR